MAKLRQRKPRQRAQIFLSYSRRDRLAVDRLFEDLKQRGYLVWMDVSEDGIEAGADWAKTLQAEMTASESVIGCLSSDFLKSTHCEDEIRQAQGEKKPIYPVIVRPLTADDDPAKFDLSQIQQIDLSQGPKAYEDGLDRLLAVLPLPPLSPDRMLRRFALPTAILVVIALLVAAIATLVLPEPEPEPLTVADKDVGIVVTKFIPETDDISAEEVDLLSRRFSNLLEQEVNATITPLRLTIGFLSPEQVGVLEGDPAVFAGKYGARIVISGSVKRGDDNRLELVPQFYIDTTIYSEVSEITGISKFGSPITIPDLKNAPTTQQILSTRTTALALTVKGLSYLVLDDYENALSAFESAAAIPGLQINEGGQAVYMMVGSTHLVMGAAQASLGELNTAGEHFSAAETIYQDIVEEAPEYARAHNGLAGVNYGRWNLTAQASETADSIPLWIAIDELDQALRLEDQPPYLYEQRALLLRVQVLYGLWANYASELTPEEHQAFLDDLRRFARQIISAYENAPSAPMKEIAAEANAYLGLTFYGTEAYDEAIDAFNDANNLSFDDSRRMYFYRWIGDCYTALGDTGAARTAYRTALELAQSLPDITPERLEEFEKNLST